MARSNVELVIRARNEASKALHTISDAIQEVVGDQRELSEQAGSTESRLSSLGRELSDLNTRFKSLREASRIGQELRRAEQALQRQEEAAKQAGEKYEELSRKVQEAEKPTKRMTNQLGASERRLEAAREKTEQLRAQVSSLSQEYDASRVAAGAMGADQDQLATLTQRAAAEFSELQTRLREIRNLSKGALTEILGDVDVANLEALSGALARVEQRMASLSQATELTGVDLSEVEAEIDQLEGSAKDLGDLRQIVSTFEQMRRESRELLRAFNESKQRTEELGREFKNTAAPSRELGEALGRSRAETSRLAGDYETASTNVRRLGQALREAGVDTSRLGDSQERIRGQIERTAQVVAESRVEIDRLADAQKMQAQAAQEAAKFESERQENLRRIQGADYAKWWESALQERDAQQQNARQVAESQRIYDQTAAAVDEASKAYANSEAQVKRVGEAHQQASSRVARLRDEQAQVQSRIDETSRAYSEAQSRLQALAEQYEKGAVPSRRTAEQLVEAQAEVKRLGAELKASEGEFKQYDQAVRAAEAALSSLTDEQQRAQERTGALQTRAQRINAAYEALGTVLRENSGDTEAVATAQQRLVAALDESATELRKAGSAAERAERNVAELAEKSERAESGLRRLGGSTKEFSAGAQNLAESVRQAETRLADFRQQGRKTLSLTQRIRGEVLALASAYIGLYGVGSGIQSIIESNMELEASQARLRMAVGDDNAAVGEELQFVRGIANELKLEFEDLSSSYSRFAASARTAGATSEETRSIFVGLVKAARANKLSADEVSRAFRAVEQIISQGQVNAEELKEQLADAGIPGTVQTMARALNVTGEELRDLLEQGQVGWQALIPFAAELERIADPSMADAIESTSASIATLRNQIFDLKILMGEAGFLDSLSHALGRVTEELERDEIQQGLVRLGDLMGDLMVTTVGLLDHLDEIILLLKLLGIAFASKSIIEFIGGLAAGAAQMREFIQTAGRARRAVILFQLALAGIGVLLAAWSIAEWAAKEFPAFGKYWTDFRKSIDLGIEEIQHRFERLGIIVSGEWKDALDLLTREWQDWVAKDFGLLADAMSSIFGEDNVVSGALENLEELLSPEDEGDYSEKQRRKLAKLEEEHERANEEIRKKWAETRKQILDPDYTPKGGDGRETDFTSVEDLLGRDPRQADWRRGGRGGDDAEQLADQMEGELDRVQERLAEMSAETLEDRLDLIRAEFEELLTYLRETGNEAGQKTVNELIDLLEAQEEAEYQRERTRKAEQEINDALAYRRDLMEMISFYQKEGDTQAVDDLKDRLNETNDEANRLIDSAIEVWESVGGQEAEAAILALQRTRTELREVETEMDLLSAHNLGETFGGDLVGFSDNFLAKIRETGDVMGSLRQTFLQFASDFLLKIAQMIAQQAIFNALQGTFGGSGDFLGGVLTGVQHEGGIAGSAANQTRTVSPLWFSNALRYHDGGIAGLKPNELPSILERGEEVLTRDDPRHRANGGSVSSSPVNVKVVNAIDSSSVVAEGLNKGEGQKAILNFMRANKKQIKSVLN